MRQVRTIILLLALALSGCTAAHLRMAGPQLSGLDCRPRNLMRRDAVSPAR